MIWAGGRTTDNAPKRNVLAIHVIERAQRDVELRCCAVALPLPLCHAQNTGSVVQHLASLIPQPVLEALRIPAASFNVATLYRPEDVQPTLRILES